jgi:hypothetical protein
MAAQLESILALARNRNHDALQVVNSLCEFEVESRWNNGIHRRLVQSKLTERPTIDQFDFAHHHSRQEQKNTILSLVNLDFLNQKKDIILVGNPGTGKSMLAKTSPPPPATTTARSSSPPPPISSTNWRRPKQILRSTRKSRSTKPQNSWSVTNSAICRSVRSDQTSFSRSSAKDTSRGPPS